MQDIDCEPMIALAFVWLVLLVVDQLDAEDLHPGPRRKSRSRH